MENQILTVLEIHPTEDFFFVLIEDEEILYSGWMAGAEVLDFPGEIRWEN